LVKSTFGEWLLLIMPSLQLRELLRQQSMLLRTVSGDLAALEARLLLCKVLDCTRADLISNPDRLVSSDQQTQYEALIARRLQREPIAKICGEKEFWGLPFKVTTDTLDPRPDTETLIEAVLGQVKGGKSAARMLDLGTGSGCILLTLLHELRDSEGVGVDFSDAALAVAQENAVRLQLGDRASFTQSDWGDKVEGLFDIIVTNPPYITDDDYEGLSADVHDYDPKLALVGGPDGLDCYRKIAPVIHKHLAPNGFFAMEMGINQERPLEQIITEHDLDVLEIRKDLAGIIRCIIGQRRGNL
jgi:release factor glutamine methyltransferase